MPLLTSLNYFAMIVGYTTIIIVILFILLFAGLILKEKYETWKWRKEQEKMKREQEAKPKEQEQKETKKENTASQASTESPNVQLSIK